MGTPTLDGSASTGSSSPGGNSGTVTLTTTQTKDIILLGIVLLQNASSIPSVTSVSDTAGLVWQKRTSIGSLVGALTQGLDVELWYAISSGTLSNDVITANFSATTGYALIACGVHGAILDVPFDPNASLPAISSNGNASAAPVSNSISTSNPHDFIFILYGDDGANSIGNPVGFSTVKYQQGNNSITFLSGLISDKTVSDSQNNVTVSLTGGNFKNWIFITDVLTGDPPVYPSRRLGMARSLLIR